MSALSAGQIEHLRHIRTDRIPRFLLYGFTRDERYKSSRHTVLYWDRLQRDLREIKHLQDLKIVRDSVITCLVFPTDYRSPAHFWWRATQSHLDWLVKDSIE